MPIDRAEALEIITVTCPHCAKGQVPEKNKLGEWVHTGGERTFSQTICWANGFRNSRFMKDIDANG